MKLRNILIIFLAVLMISGCKNDDESLDIEGTKAPEVNFALDELNADLNKTDNLPVVGVISSSLGLKSVKMYIVEEGENVFYKEITTFFNDKAYSFSEKLDFKSTYESFKVEAIDKGDRVASGVLDFKLVPLKEAPVVVFTPDKISYDEMNPTPLPRTKFVVTSTAGLKSIEMTLVTKEGLIPYGQVLEFNDAPLDYYFDEMINYDEKSKDFRVKVTDIYGQVKYGNLEIEYKTVPAPVMSIATELINSADGQNVEIPIRIESVAGVKKIEIFRIEKTVETSIYTQNYSGEKELDITPRVNLTMETTGIKVVVSDVTISERTDTKNIRAIIGFNFIENYQVGSQVYAAGIAEFPGVYPLFSLKDLVAYSVDDALGVKESSIDMKFYLYGVSAVPRIYAMDGGATGTKNNEFKGRTATAANFTTMNATRFLKLTAGYDFDNATVGDLSQIIASQITSNVINPIAAGDVIAFKTASTSSVGGNKIGIIKISKIVNTNPASATQGEFTISVKFPK